MQNNFNNPQVSIISVNFNGFKDTCEMIDSLKNHLMFSFELIIIDNASEKDEISWIEELYPWVKCIRSDKNLGFAGGNNLGIKQAKGEYILLLNNDTYVVDHSLQQLVDFLKNNPKVGAVSPKLKFAAFPDEIQFAGYTAFSKITSRNRIIGYGEKDKGQYDVPTPHPYLHGAAMMFKREVIDKVGGLPEVYFLYYEELDWCERIKEAGYELWYVPFCTVYHKESKSVGVKSPLKIYYQTRNRLLFVWRNGRGISKYLSVFYQLTIALAKNVVVSLTSGRADLVDAAFGGAFGFLKMKK